MGFLDMKIRLLFVVLIMNIVAISEQFSLGIALAIAEERLTGHSGAIAEERSTGHSGAIAEERSTGFAAAFVEELGPLFEIDDPLELIIEAPLSELMAPIKNQSDYLKLIEEYKSRAIQGWTAINKAKYSIKK